MADTKSKPANNSSTDNQESKYKVVNAIGIIIIILSGGLLIFLIVMARENISCTPADNPAFGRVKELMGILVPVISTWMGTILAFYFTKENYEAANRNVSAMVKQVTGTDEKLQEQKAKDVMMKPEDFSLLLEENEAKFKEENVNVLIKKMEDSHSERMAILQKGTLKFIFLIYRTTLERFAFGYNEESIKLNSGIKKDTYPPAKLTVKDMYESDYKTMKDILALDVKNYFVSETATLAEVREKMKDNTICQDVFITKTGKTDEPVLGWITNNMVAEKADLFKKAGTKV